MIGTVEGLREYAGARGLDVPGLNDDQLCAQALQRANDYIYSAYLVRFVPPYDETLPNVELATYEAALIELETPGFFNTVYKPGERKVLTQVDTIQWTLLPGGDASSDPTPVSGRIAALLEPYCHAVGIAVYVI